MKVKEDEDKELATGLDSWMLGTFAELLWRPGASLARWRGVKEQSRSEEGPRAGVLIVHF